MHRTSYMYFFPHYTIGGVRCQNSVAYLSRRFRAANFTSFGFYSHRIPNAVPEANHPNVLVHTHHLAAMGNVGKPPSAFSIFKLRSWDSTSVSDMTVHRGSDEEGDYAISSDPITRA